MPNSTVEIHTDLLDKITENIDVDGIYLKAGILEGATGSEGGKAVKPAEYAYKHEFGIGVPQRAFLRPTLNEKRDEWTAQFQAMLPSFDYDISKTLEAMRTTVEGQIMERIRSRRFNDEGENVPLSKFTIAYKNSKHYADPEAPLIATTTMITSIGSEVVDK